MARICLVAVGLFVYSYYAYIMPHCHTPQRQDFNIKFVSHEKAQNHKKMLAFRPIHGVS